MKLLTNKFSLEGIGAYLITGLTLTLLGVFCLLNGVGLYSFIVESTFERREWSIFTGSIIGLCFLWQWRLHFKKVVTGSTQVNIELVRHKWVGAFMIALLFIHATSMGFAIQKLLSYGMLVIVMSGIFHTQFLRSRLKLGEKTWKLLHVGLSAFILPLIALHAWIALAYKG